MLASLVPQVADVAAAAALFSSASLSNLASCLLRDLRTGRLSGDGGPDSAAGWQANLARLSSVLLEQLVSVSVAAGIGAAGKNRRGGCNKTSLHDEDC